MATPKKTRTYPYDTARQLRTEEERAAYLEAALEDGDPQLIAAAREDVARSRALVYTYEVLPRLAELGGGWRLRLLERGQEGRRRRVPPGERHGGGLHRSLWGCHGRGGRLAGVEARGCYPGGLRPPVGGLARFGGQLGISAIM